jgi:hypothetical protein
MLQLGAEAISASSLYGGCGPGDQIRSDVCDGDGPTRTEESIAVLAGRALTAPRQLTATGHARKALSMEIGLIANVHNTYRGGPNCAPAWPSEERSVGPVISGEA